MPMLTARKIGQGILAREKSLFCLALFKVNGLGNILQVLLVVFIPGQFQNCPGLGNPAFLD